MRMNENEEKDSGLEQQTRRGKEKDITKIVFVDGCCFRF